MNRVKLLQALDEHGLLLLQDAVLPSVTLLVLGAPVRGSWWGHPRGHEIFDGALALANHPDALDTKLVNAKVTFLHRRHWPALLATAMAREAWQLKGLTDGARWLLEFVDGEGAVPTDRLEWTHRSPRKAGQAAAELQKRLLLHASDYHTESGAHARRLESWRHWSARNRIAPCPSADQGRNELDGILSAWKCRFRVPIRAPWG